MNQKFHIYLSFFLIIMAKSIWLIFLVVPAIIAIVVVAIIAKNNQPVDVVVNPPQTSPFRPMRNNNEKFVHSRNMGLMRNLELTPWYCENEFQCCMKNHTSHYDPVERSAHSLGRTLSGNYAIQPYNTHDFPTTPDERLRYQKCELRRRLCRMGRLNNYSDILMRGHENTAP